MGLGYLAGGEAEDLIFATAAAEFEGGGGGEGLAEVGDAGRLSAPDEAGVLVVGGVVLGPGGGEGELIVVHDFKINREGSGEY